MPQPTLSQTSNTSPATLPPNTVSGAHNSKRPDEDISPNGRTAPHPPELHVNGAPLAPVLRSKKSSNGSGHDETAWGSHFWVTLVDPQSQVSFFACPATGEVSWDPPVGNFVLPPNKDGEWWEISDESRGGIPYYYHTKSGKTVWDRPEGFVIPLTVLQNTALGRRLSKTFNTTSVSDASKRPVNRRSRTNLNERNPSQVQIYSRPSQSSTRSSPGQTYPPAKRQPPMRRSLSSDQYNTVGCSTSQPHSQQPGRSWSHGTAGLAVSQLPPIPGSPYATEASAPSTPTSSKSRPAVSRKASNHSIRSEKEDVAPIKHAEQELPNPVRSKSSASYHPSRSPPQSLSAAVEMLSQKQAQTPPHSPMSMKTVSTESGYASQLDKAMDEGKSQAIPPPVPMPITPTKTKAPRVGGKIISLPILNAEATSNMSPVKRRAAGKPIPVERAVPPTPRANVASLSTGLYPILPEDLASDIQQFVESNFCKTVLFDASYWFPFPAQGPHGTDDGLAKGEFSTLIILSLRQLMRCDNRQAPLTSPLLNITRSLHKDAVKAFKVIQRLMGDREREARPGRLQNDGQLQSMASLNTSTHSLSSGSLGMLEEERWLLGEGLTHGELRDEIYCQLMKQLTGNSNAESQFKGWQILCVLLVTFPPSKNFETYFRSFLQQRTSQTEGRVDVMAKYCLKRLSVIAKRGPRGKPPSMSEIETASDAAFNPSTFGEPLDAIFRLQERNYPHQRIPIILPFLADGILALGGTKAEGIFRVPGDGDSVSELKLRIDKGYYNLEGVDDPHVLASLLKLWLRELCDPLVPDEMYNECITNASDPEACVSVVERLPTINRRVVLFIISFLQLFLDERVLAATKMTSANLALVMAPNLLRCSSESMAVVFTNALYEQTFVHNLLLNLRCTSVDPDYVPQHGLGAVLTGAPPRTSKSRSRRMHG
ncbi:hypothetical protein EW146_g5582 [Bondarzewia mesenterica]|uniref:Rho-GAP domain-containing protein n=1 Tax=Bondarzewia mesenterica TaxID=1095465 RepID=A0A4V3XES5_9AGAM|nr:hypothetical protein EW146_g5582 [Bondarzewia mesenterica]